MFNKLTYTVKKKPKIEKILVTKKDMAKIPTDLNSRSLEEQLVNFSRKSETKNSFRRWWVQTILEMYLTDLKAVKKIIIKRKVAKIL